MSRVIKFRAWNKSDRVMINNLNSATIVNGELFHDDDDILMQFSGFKDKNGLDIYEGDILVQSDARRFMLVSFEKGCFVITGTWQANLCSFADSCLVIGNIHENPELLEAP